MRAPQTVRVTGGAHLTVAFALGSALPATLVGNVTAEGTDDSVWQTGTVSAPPSAVALTRIEGHGARPVTATGTAKNVLAYVDHIRGRLGGAGRHDLPERPHRDGFGGTITTVGPTPTNLRWGPLSEGCRAAVRSVPPPEASGGGRRLFREDTADAEMSAAAGGGAGHDVE